jgi:hypothetical protein
MTLYLTDNTPPAEIARPRRRSGFVHAVKLYPAGATTNSDAGVTDLARATPALAAMQQPACRCWCTARSPTRRRRLRPRGACSSSACWRRCWRDYPGPALRARAHHDAEASRS